MRRPSLAQLARLFWSNAQAARALAAAGNPPGALLCRQVVEACATADAPTSLRRAAASTARSLAWVEALPAPPANSPFHPTAA
jgi:hypothetical protein